MRVEVLQAVLLIAGLHVLGPLVDPPAVPPGELAGHVGEQVVLTGRVREVEPGRTVTAVELEGEGGRARVLTRTDPPPLGALVRIVGDASAGREGLVLWAKGRWTVTQVPDPAPRSLAALLATASRFEGTTVATVGRFDPEASVLRDDGHELAATWRAAPPGPGPVLAWGLLGYAAEDGRYRLAVTGWRPWPPPGP